LLDSNLGEPSRDGACKMAKVAPEIARPKRKRSTYMPLGEPSEDKIEAILTRGWAPSDEKEPIAVSASRRRLG
jgi:hypothetical protein